MLIASWKARAAVPVALVLACAVAPAHGQSKAGSVPTLSISATQVAGQKFHFTGTVTGLNLAASSVTLTGAAQGVVPCDSSGNFDATFDVPTLGIATAVASDGVVSTAPVDLTLSNAAPATNCRAIIRGDVLIISG